MVEQEPCVLIVDDEQGDLDRIEKALASIRLRILTVSDPHEVLRKVESEHPHLVILDALLPGLSGFDLCKQIKTESETKDTLVVILTGVYLKEHYRREAIHQFKADGFVTKPFRDRDLQRLVLKLVAKAHRMSPKETQDWLVTSGDILLNSELEEKPGWFGRIFGRLTGGQAPAEPSGFMHTAKEGQVTEEQPIDEVDHPEATAVQAETKPEGEEGEIVEDSRLVETEGAPEKKATSADEEPVEASEPDQIARGDDDGDSRKEQGEEKTEESLRQKTVAEKEPEKPQEDSARTEAGGETELAKQAGEAKSLGPEDEQELEEAAAESVSPPSPDSGVSVLDSAKAVFEALGDDEDTEPKSESAEAEAVTEDIEESATEKTMPAVATVLPEPEGGVLEEPNDAEEAVGAPVVTPSLPPRPRALHGELPIYNEEDYLHELQREVWMCDRLGRPITLIVVSIADIDQIVELLGKSFRPKVLLHVAQHALESLREIDMVGLLHSKELIALTAFASDRYGGEKIVSRLRTVLRYNPFEVGVGLPSFIPDLRFGMAVYPKDAADIDEMLECAEAELAATRRSG